MVEIVPILSEEYLPRTAHAVEFLLIVMHKKTLYKTTILSISG